MCLFVEKQAINWLFHRWGCTYNRLQKFIELDLRQQAIMSIEDPKQEKWEVVPPPYNTDRYNLHYFYNNFKQLQEKLIETAEVAEEKENLAFYGYHKEIRTFIPHKQAVRMREMINFSVRLDGRAPDLKISQKDKKKLDKMEKDW